MENKQFTEMTSFADVCAANGVNEADYAIKPEASAKVNEAISRERLLLQSKAAYGGKLPDMTDTDEDKYTPVHRIIKDEKAPFGFRLSFDGCVFGFVSANFGARPPFPDSTSANHSGRQFPEEYAQWLYYLNKSYQE